MTIQTKIKIGQKWVYNKNGSRAVWEVIEIDNNIITGKFISSILPLPGYNPGTISTISLGEPSWNNEWTLLEENNILPIHNGMNCSKCNGYNKYISSGNQPDGTFICYSCRK